MTSAPEFARATGLVTAMAAKKKKKAASNPARGFATVSLPSKAKADNDALDAEAAQADGGNAELLGHTSPGVVDVSQPSQVPSSIQGMTADQLEEHLEEAELQSIVERSAERSRREATRQMSRLETERRTLRAQAMPLETDHWLTEDLVEGIFNLHQNSGVNHGGSPQLPYLDKDMQQDDLLVKLWTLQQVLRLFKAPHEDRVLKHVVSLTSKCNSSSKDYIWGLEESLDWLALNAAPEELPSYQPRIPAIRTFPGEYGAPPSSSEGSRATSPMRKASNGSKMPAIESTGTSAARGMDTNGANHSDALPPSSTDTDDSTDDDNDPDGLVSKYIDTKLQLLKLEPEFQYEESPITDVTHGKGLKPSQVSRLHRKAETIQRDILFDHDKANAQLNETLNQIRADISKHRAERRATKPLAEDTTASFQDSSEVPKIAPDPAEAEDTLGGLFGEMFTPVETFTPNHDQKSPNEDDGSVLLLDFGKWTGISPRRVLEDTCKTR